MLTFKLNFMLEVYLMESREVSLNGNMYDFLVDYNFIDESDILNIH